MAKRSTRIFLGIIVTLFLVLTYFKDPKTIDTRETYAGDDKIPYGTYVVRKQIGDVLGEVEVDLNYDPFSQWLPYRDKSEKSSLVIITGNTAIGEVDAEILLEYVSEGNTLFLAYDGSDEFIFNKMDLMAEVESYWYSDTSSRQLLVNPAFRKDTALQSTVPVARYISLFYSFGGEVLGINKKDKQPNFIRVPYGSGEVLIHVIPEAFTNRQVLQTPDYAANCLAYLPKQKVYWDEHYKPYRQASQEPMQFIRENKSLRLGWRILLWGTLLGFLFFARRKQRAIPVIPLPENKSLEFIETVGDLYFQNGNHTDLARKKLAYFHHHIRGRYHLHEQDSAYWEKLTKRCPASEKTLEKIRKAGDFVSTHRSVTAGFLEELNRNIEDFYIQTGKYPKHE